jgi:hypothetical protein
MKYEKYYSAISTMRGPLPTLEGADHSCLGEGAVAIAAIAYSFYTPEERRVKNENGHKMKLGGSIGVFSRRDPG